MVGELMGKYAWLIEILRSAGIDGLTIKQIARKYEQAYGESYSRSSFNNHRYAIEEIFGIPIECNRSTNTYFIPFSEDTIDSDASREWLINTFTVNNLLTLGKERLSGRVSVEDIPSGHKLLPVIMEAMKDNRRIVIEYRKYGSEEAETRHLDPYGVREFEKRWYVAGYSMERASMRVYSLDRILSMKISQETFTIPENFDIEELFHDSFGVYLPQEGQKAVSIIIRAGDKEANYLRDLPIHRSQAEIGRDDRGVLFRIRVIPNDNLYMVLERYGKRIEVISPPGVRERIGRELHEAASIYKNDNQ